MNQKYEEDAIKGLDTILTPIVYLLLSPFWILNKLTRKKEPERKEHCPTCECCHKTKPKTWTKSEDFYTDIP